jgi:hypothetical protein
MFRRETFTGGLPGGDIGCGTWRKLFSRGTLYRVDAGRLAICIPWRRQLGRLNRPAGAFPKVGKCPRWTFSAAWEDRRVVARNFHTPRFGQTRTLHRPSTGRSGSPRIAVRELQFSYQSSIFAGFNPAFN